MGLVSDAALKITFKGGIAMKPKEFKDKLRGVVNLVMTPFKENGELDEEALKISTRKLVERCKGEEIVVLALGTTGEFYAMSEAENCRVAEIVVDEVNGVFPVMIGSARAATQNTIEASKAMQSIGADAVLVTHPYYIMPNLESIKAHYKAVADALDIGVVIYNNSATSKLWLDTASVQELSKVENIVGLKENTNNPMIFLNMLQKLDPNDIAIFAGLGHVMYQFMCFYGCTGYVTEFSNFAPELTLDLYKAGQAKDIAGIRKAVDTMNILWDYMDALAARHSKIPSVLPPSMVPGGMPYYQSLNKAAMDLMGIPGGKTRAPMYNLTKQEYAELAQVLTKMGLQVVGK